MKAVLEHRGGTCPSHGANVSVSRERGTGGAWLCNQCRVASAPLSADQAAREAISSVIAKLCSTPSCAVCAAQPMSAPAGAAVTPPVADTAQTTAGADASLSPPDAAGQLLAPNHGSVGGGRFGQYSDDFTREWQPAMPCGCARMTSAVCDVIVVCAAHRGRA